MSEVETLRETNRALLVELANYTVKVAEATTAKQFVEEVNRRLMAKIEALNINPRSSNQAATSTEDDHLDKMSEIEALKQKVARMEAQQQHCEKLAQARFGLRLLLAELTGLKVRLKEATTSAQVASQDYMSQMKDLHNELAELRSEHKSSICHLVH
mmetsp:Transcript_25710/g.40277  ORF Transcript_25710/g.40277 Transcript_25710/m.40277 type:complete len:157 (-) Transcript_25710:1589-2059(-)